MFVIGKKLESSRLQKAISRQGSQAVKLTNCRPKDNRVAGALISLKIGNRASIGDGGGEHTGAANENAFVLEAGDRLPRLFGDKDRSLTEEADITLGYRHKAVGFDLVRLRSSWMKWQRAPYGQ